jgi:hypothetical protein
LRELAILADSGISNRTTIASCRAMLTSGCKSLWYHSQRSCSVFIAPIPSRSTQHTTGLDACFRGAPRPPLVTRRPLFSISLASRLLFNTSTTNRLKGRVSLERDRKFNIKV